MAFSVWEVVCDLFHLGCEKDFDGMGKNNITQMIEQVDSMDLSGVSTTMPVDRVRQLIKDFLGRKLARKEHHTSGASIHLYH